MTDLTTQLIAANKAQAVANLEVKRINAEIKAELIADTPGFDLNDDDWASGGDMMNADRYIRHSDYILQLTYIQGDWIASLTEYFGERDSWRSSNAKLASVALASVIRQYREDLGDPMETLNAMENLLPRESN